MVSIPQAWLADVLVRVNDRKITEHCRAVARALGRGNGASQTGGMSADTIARLKITLDEVKVAVLRWSRWRSQSANGSEMI
jgi:hypothetical protein